VVRRRCRRPIRVQLIIIVLNLLNMEDIRLRSLVIILSLVQDGEVTDSPSLEVVQLPFPVEKEYRILKLLSPAPLLSLALLLSPMIDTRDHPVVAMKRLLDLHTLVDIILTVATDLPIMHLLVLLLGSLRVTRAATEVPVILSSLELILLQGQSTILTVITLPIKVVGGES